MDIEQEYMCRLCLKVVTNEFAEIDEVVAQMFNILLVKLDLNIARDPIICWDCVEVAKKCLNFKLTCFDTELIILSFSLDSENAKHNIKTIYKEYEDAKMVLDEDLDICRICMTRLEGHTFDLFDILKDEKTMFKISEYLPEIDLNNIENPRICTTCKENLEDYFKFVVNKLDMKGKINPYCKTEDIKSTDQVNSGASQNSLVKDILEYPEKSAQIGAIKEESNMFGTTKCVYREVHIGVTNLKTYKCSLPSSEGKHKSFLKRHMLAVSEIKMHKCSLCGYEAKRKSNLASHMLVHKDVSEIEMYRCEFCTFETKRNRNLKSHMLMHKDVSEIKMYKCSLCAYEARHKTALKNHMLVHEDIKMHKCSLCAFATKQEYSLKKHMLVHKDVSEIEMYKCSFCDYEAKQKGSLRYHMIVHKDVAEIKTHKCSLCDYEAIYKYKIKNHMLVHKDISEIEMHKCSLCPYEAKHKCSLRKHMLGHMKYFGIKNV